MIIKPVAGKELLNRSMINQACQDPGEMLERKRKAMKAWKAKESLKVWQIKERLKGKAGNRKKEYKKRGLEEDIKRQKKKTHKKDLAATPGP